MKKFSLAVIGALLLLSACSTATPAVPAGSSVAAVSLPGTSWTVNSIKGTATLDGHQPTMQFDADKVSGLASCNRYSGGYTSSGAELKFSQFAVTQMACVDQAVTTQEATFLATVATVAAVRSAGTGLELLDASQAVALTLVPVENKPLEGTTWKLSGIISNEAVSSPAAGSTATITIADGQLSGKACNSFSGTVTAGEDGSFEVGPLRSTKMACPSEELSKQETAILTTLEAATSYQIEGSALTLKAADGTGLEFIAA